MLEIVFFSTGGRVMEGERLFRFLFSFSLGLA